MPNQHTTACATCPFRKKSAPGWLGAATPDEFLEHHKAKPEPSKKRQSPR